MLIDDHIAHELTTWAADFVRQRAEFLRRRKYEATGTLTQSIEYELVRAAQRNAVEVLIAFEDHGRFIDMKSLTPAEGGTDYILALQAWVERKGFVNRFTQGYMKRHNIKTVPADILSRIAWGIAVKRSTGKMRRRRWWNKSKTAAIYDAFNKVAASLPPVAAQEVAKSFGDTSR